MRRLGMWLVGAACVAGCAGMPPKPQPAQLQTAAPLSDLPGGASWPVPDWWKRYGDPDLDRLIDLALDYSPTLASAHARLDSARRALRVAMEESRPNRSISSAITSAAKSGDARNL